MFPPFEVCLVLLTPKVCISVVDESKTLISQTVIHFAVTRGRLRETLLTAVYLTLNFLFLCLFKCVLQQQ